MRTGSRHEPDNNPTTQPEVAEAPGAETEPRVPWSADLAFDVWWEVLSCFEAHMVARCALALYGESPSAYFIAAHNECVEEVDELLGCAWLVALHAMDPVDAGIQRHASKWTKEFARAAWWRADMLAPPLAKARAEPNDLCLHPTEFDDDSLQALFEAQVALVTRDAKPFPFADLVSPIVTSAGFQMSDEVRALLWSFERMSGKIDSATQASVVRRARGMANTLSAGADVPMRSLSTPGEQYEHLLNTGARLKGDPRTAPLAPLVVFVHAVGLVGFSEDILEALNDGQVPMFTRFAKHFLDKVGPYHGPLEYVRKSLGVLGHQVEEFTRAQRLRDLHARDAKNPDRTNRAPGGRKRKSPKNKG